MVPVTVVTGFLGAGKTTFVNAWLASRPRGSIAVVVNEVGAVGVDGELLAARVRTLVEITGGCVCCRTQAELVRALERLASEDPPPARIVVETSGAASPAGVLRVLAKGGESGAFGLDGIVTVIDATRIAPVLAHDLAIEQLACADVVVVSRAEGLAAAELGHVGARVGDHAGAAIVVHAERGVLVDGERDPVEALLERARATVPTRAIPAPTAAHVYETISLEHDGSLDGERFADFVEETLGSISGRIFRTKGIVGIAGLEARMVVQGVADLVEVDFGAPWEGTPRTSRLVVVGYGLDREALARAFAACAA